MSRSENLVHSPLLLHELDFGLLCAISTRNHVQEKDNHVVVVVVVVVV